MTAASLTESILEPELPIVDAHHHLWVLPEVTLAELESKNTAIARAAPVFRRHARYLLDEYLTDIQTGHNVRASVFVDAHTMYRRSGPEGMKSVGEVEFVNGVAAMAESGIFCEARVCAAIVGGIDLTLGEAVEDVLVAHIQAGGGRYRGIRSTAVVPYDDDPSLLGRGVGVPHLLLDGKFRAGIKRATALGLSYEAWLLEPQLPELIDLARALPETQIILNHAGAPVGVGRYAGQREARFPIWRESLRMLAQCPNVVAKLGGLGIPFGGFGSYMSSPPATSEQLAAEWKPYIHTCIEVLGARRCMFESNFPVDAAVACYPVLWNAFKRLTAFASPDEKAALFCETAIRTYRLEL